MRSAATQKKFIALVLFSVFVIFSCVKTVDHLSSLENTSFTQNPVNTSALGETIGRNYYVDGASGNDNFLGTAESPWKTIKKAVETVKAGETIVVRGGEYQAIDEGWSFKSSGTEFSPITLTNYPNEQVVIKVNGQSETIRSFRCWSTADWPGVKADYVKIVGTPVAERVLSNGVKSSKGIVIQGPDQGYTMGGTIWGSDCDYWEVAGVDFINVGYGIFTLKLNNQTTEDHSTSHWYVHDNRVYGFWAESGFQFNGDYNRIENNQIYKVHSQQYNAFGCQMINILGHHNVIKKNLLDEAESTLECNGVLLEWDIADYNLIEGNEIRNVDIGIFVSSGDHNTVVNNLIYATKQLPSYSMGVMINAYDNKTDWPCDDAFSIQPANDPGAPDYQYFYNPRNCHATDNKVLNNTIVGFSEGVRLYALIPENTVVQNNAFYKLSRGNVCWYQASTGTCKSLSGTSVVDQNKTAAAADFVSDSAYDFHLARPSSLIDTALALPDVTFDFDNVPRPQGSGYDYGAFESTAMPTSVPSPVSTATPIPTIFPTITQTPSPLPTATRIPTATLTPTTKPCSACDFNSDGWICQNDVDLQNACYGIAATGSCARFDMNGDGIINILDSSKCGSCFNCLTPTPTIAPFITVTPIPTVLPATISFEAESGAYTRPFVRKGRSISQSIVTLKPDAGGRATYNFNIITAGNYIIETLVYAPSLSSNSVFINIDGEPTDPLMVWDIPTSSKYQKRIVTWRGNGADGSPQFAPKVFYLNAGSHQLIIRGREAYTFLDNFEIKTAPVN